MMWARTIIGLALGWLLIKNFWNTLMKTLGVGTSVYEKLQDEKEQIKESKK